MRGGSPRDPVSPAQMAAEAAALALARRLGALPEGPIRARAAASPYVYRRRFAIRVSEPQGFAPGVSENPPGMARWSGAGPHATGGAPGGARAPHPSGDEGQASMTAGDVAIHIGDALMELTARRRVVPREE